MDYQVEKKLVYKLAKDYDGELIAIKATTEDGQVMFIPLDEANTDYQEYLAWTKASPKNKALPADE